MLMQKLVAVDNRSFDVLQRAFDGACWSVGIPATLVEARSTKYLRPGRPSR